MPPIDPTLPLDPRTLAAALDYREAMKESGDIAEKMLRTFKGLSDILSATTRMTGDSAVDFTKMAEMSKQVLSNTKTRGQIDQQIYSQNESAEARILQLQFKKIKYAEDLAKIQTEAAQSQLEFEQEEARFQHSSYKEQDIINKANLDAGLARTMLTSAASEIDKSVANDLLATILKEKKEAEERLRLSQQTRDEAKETAAMKQREASDGMAYYDEKIKKEKEIVEQNKKASVEIKRQQGFMSHLKDSSYEALGGLGKMIKSAEDFAKAIEFAVIEFVILEKLLMLGYERFVALDKAAENFRKETGFSIHQMVQLRSDAESVNRQFQDMGVGVEQAYASAKALTDVFGRTSLATKETMGNVALLSANLGVAEADTANVLANFQGLGKATQEAAMNVIKVGAGISEKAGVPFKLVMNDIANASEQTTAMLGANPSKLMKSAIAARALGTDMNKIVSSQRKLLDYSSSINDELETSALLGRSISFQKSRQLAYDGDIVGAAKATLETVKRAGDFEKMSVYQREALAKAAGMELKDLTKMMAVEKQRDAILLGGDEAKKETLRKQDAELENLKNMASLDDADLVKQNEKAIMQQKMQGLMSNFANTFQSLLVSLADILEPIVRVTAMVLVPIFKILAALIRGMLKPILNIGQALMGNAENTKKFAAFAEKVSTAMVTVYDWSEKIGEAIGTFSTPLIGMFELIERISGSAGRFTAITRNIAAWFLKGARAVEIFGSGLSGIFSVFKPITTVISTVLKGFSTFAKFLGPIGLIITAVQVVVDWVGQLMDIWSSDDMDLGEKILASLAAIPTALYNVLVKPFIDAIDWVLNYFNINFSVGEFFKELVDGMMKLGTMMIQPFVNSMYELWEAVMDIFDGKDIGMNILKGIWSVGKLIVQAILWPFTAAWGLLYNTFIANSPSELGLMIVDGIKSIGSMLLDALTWPFRTAFNFISGIFGGDGDLGDTIIDGVKSIAGFVFDVLTWPHRKLLDFVTGLFGGDGDIVGTMIDGIKTAAGFIFDVLTLPFRSIVNFISGIFGGDGNLGTSIVDGIKSSFGAAFDFITSAFSFVVDSIKNAASEIFGFITSPFKKALEFVKNIPFIGKLFGGNDVAAESKPQIDSTTMETAGVIEVKNLDALREVVQQLTDAVANLGKSDNTETLTAGTKIDTSALEAKLDTLTNLLVGGAVRVYLDGSDVSAAMSATGR